MQATSSLCNHANFILAFMHLLENFLGLPSGSAVKKSACNAEDATGAEGCIRGSGRSPGEGNGNPTLVLLPGKSHGQRSLVGYSPWGHKESDTT